jgi:hypothetical protein
MIDALGGHTHTMANPSLVGAALQLGELLPAALAECVTHTGKSIKLDEHHPFVLFLYQEVREHHTLDDTHFLSFSGTRARARTTSPSV